MELLINNRLISQLMFSFKKSRFANTTVFDSLTTVQVRLPPYTVERHSRIELCQLKFRTNEGDVIMITKLICALASSEEISRPFAQ